MIEDEVTHLNEENEDLRTRLAATREKCEQFYQDWQAAANESDSLRAKVAELERDRARMRPSEGEK